jgi:hypothetical protein
VRVKPRRYPIFLKIQNKHFYSPYSNEILDIKALEYKEYFIHWYVANSEDFTRYLAFNLQWRNNPNWWFYISVGTNDIQRKEPDEIVAEMKSLCQGIVSQSLSKITISEIIKRQDPVINIKIDKTNSLLAKLCGKFKWQFIRHTNIDASKLNASGLHLNSQGTAMLAKNLIESLKNWLNELQHSDIDDIDYFYKIIKSINIGGNTNNIELSTMCETRKSTLRYEHNSNLNYIDNQ